MRAKIAAHHRIIGTAEIEPVGDPPCRYAGEDPRKGILRPGRQQLVGFLEHLSPLMPRPSTVSSNGRHVRNP